MVSGRGRAMVAMSGGVDSSVAALLLREQGYDVAGVTMRLGLPGNDDVHQGSGRAEELSDARRVCDACGIPHHVLDCAEPFQEHVVADFREQYRKGRTPNPCVRCNRYLKFGLLLAWARAQEYDCLATGHYASIVAQEGRWFLRRAADRSKDQSYFLYGIERAGLGDILFPLHGLTKDEVRRLAVGAGLPVAERSESQDLCFAGGGGYRALIAGSGEAGRPGDIVDTNGATLGHHNGIEHFTVGQRRGLGLRADRPMHVVRLEPARNRVVVGERDGLLCAGALLRDFNLLVDSLPPSAQAQIRYTHTPARASIRRAGDAVEVLFDEAQESVTPGQSAVLYEGDTVVGGGVIDAAIGSGGTDARDGRAAEPAPARS